MEAHVIVHSVFCFTLLCVCVLHSLCVCLEGHSALLHTPRFQWGPPFSVGDPIFPLSTVYGLPLCLGGVQGVLRRMWGAQEDAQAPESQGERG